jgi:hypothetical protein
VYGEKCHSAGLCNDGIEASSSLSRNRRTWRKWTSIWNGFRRDFSLVLLCLLAQSRRERGG